MLDLVHEAGWVAWIVVGIAIGGAVVAVRWRSRDIAVVAATLTLALSLCNASVGQHKVDRAVRAEADPAEKIAILSAGTGEAMSNLFVGGTCATLLLIVGFLARRSAPKP